MDLNPNLVLKCPACGHHLTQREQRRMNQFWRGLQNTSCSECGSLLMWDPSLHSKLRWGGRIFKVGIALILIAIAAIAAFGGPRSAPGLCLSVGVVAVITGLLVTRTPNDQVKVKLVENGSDV